MATKLSQQLKQEQGLNLSPVQLLTSKLVELTTIELEQRIERELEENPALEEGTEPSDEDRSAESDSDSELDAKEQDWELGEYASEDDIPSYKLRELQERQSFREEIPFASSAPSLDTLLLEQLSIEGLSPQDEQLARYIIGNISSEGYLTREPLDLQDELLFKEGLDVSLGQIEAMITRIKTLEPAGIGASSLQECLLLQLRRRDPLSTLDQLCILVLTRHYDDFTAKRFEKLSEALSIDKDKLSELYQEIGRLDPKPGIGFSNEYEDRLTHYTPDFVVWEEDNGDLNLSLVNEREIRPLRLSTAYQQMLNEVASSNARKQRDTQDFIKHKLEQARWFIDAISQRQETLKKTMFAIINWQRAFFLSGDIADLRPMILKDIAEVTGLDISTISRVSNSKSVQTRHGIYPIKFFFGDGLITESGDEVSTKAIKQELQQLIDNENKQKPLTDEELANELLKLGYPLARRTIAKYRESLKLPVARLRKEL